MPSPITFEQQKPKLQGVHETTGYSTLALAMSEHGFGTDPVVGQLDADLLKANMPPVDHSPCAFERL